MDNHSFSQLNISPQRNVAPPGISQPGTPEGSSPERVTPEGSAFGRTVSEAPPTYDSVMADSSQKPLPAANGSANADRPPAYMPVDCSSLLNLNAIPAQDALSYDGCIDKLSMAYRVRLGDLAQKIYGPGCHFLYAATEVMTRNLIGPGTASRRMPEELKSLAEQLFALFQSGWKGTTAYPNKNKLAFTLCLYFLEQKAKAQIAATSPKKESTDKKADDPSVSDPASSVRKQFFKLFYRFTEEDRVATAGLSETIESFLVKEGLTTLCKELRCEASASATTQKPRADSGKKTPLPPSNFNAEKAKNEDSSVENEQPPTPPKLSELNYQDIPGALPHPKLRPQVESCNRMYGVNFFDLIDIIGDIRGIGGVRGGLPIRELTCRLLAKRDSQFRQSSLKKETHFKDRNAKFIIVALDHYHKEVFSATEGQRPYPVQESSADEQKKAEIMHNFMQFLLDGLKSKSMNSTRRDVSEFVYRKKWPKQYIPEAYHDGKVPR